MDVIRSIDCGILHPFEICCCYRHTAPVETSARYKVPRCHGPSWRRRSTPSWVNTVEKRRSEIFSTEFKRRRKFVTWYITVISKPIFHLQYPWFLEELRHFLVVLNEMKGQKSIVWQHWGNRDRLASFSVIRGPLRDVKSHLSVMSPANAAVLTFLYCFQINCYANITFE